MSRAGEFAAQVFVLGRVSGLHDVFSAGSEYLQQRGSIVMLGGVDRCLNGFFRSRKGALRRTECGRD